MFYESSNKSEIYPYDGDENFPLLMPRWGYVISAFVLFVIGFFGFFLNLLVILLMFKDRQLWTPLNIILFNLVCSDFSVSVLGNPFTLVSALYHRWIFGRDMCVMYGFFMALLGITSITTLTVLSFERYMLVSKPLSSRHLSSKGAVLLVIFIWSYSLALTTPPLIGWGKYVPEAANISCSVNWHEQSTNTLTYILYLFAMGQIVPMSVIGFSYVNIVRTMRQNSQRLGRVSRAEAKVTVMVFLMIISFTIAWTPYSIFALIEQFGTDRMISPGAGVIPALVAKSSICYNPLIYVGMNTQFRQSIKRLLGIHSKEVLSQTERAFDTTITMPSRRQHSEARLPNKVKKMDAKRITTLDKPIESNFNDKTTTKLVILRENNKLPDTASLGETIFNCDDPQESCQIIQHGADSENKRLIDESKNKLVDVYKNEGFVEHSTDLAEEHKGTITKVKIKQSCSMDFSLVQKDSKRKFSVECKVDTKCNRNSFVDRIFNDSKCDDFKTFLCNDELNSRDDNV